MFIEFRPSPLLTPYVDTYWISSNGSSDSSQSSGEHIRILPDGCVDLIFNMSDSGAHGLRPFVPHVIGTMTVWADAALDISMMGVRFRPCAISAFTRVPVCEFTDRRVETGLFSSLFDDFRGEELYEQPDDRARVRYLDDYLMRKLSRAYAVDRYVTAAAELILNTRGTVPIDRLTDDVCLCRRQLERWFKALVGITPKLFSAIVRFNHARSYIERHPEQSLFRAAIACGYYDHSHLVRDFKRFAGSLPCR